MARNRSQDDNAENLNLEDIDKHYPEYANFFRLLFSQDVANKKLAVVLSVNFKKELEFFCYCKWQQIKYFLNRYPHEDYDSFLKFASDNKNKKYDFRNGTYHKRYFKKCPFGKII